MWMSKVVKSLRDSLWKRMFLHNQSCKPHCISLSLVFFYLCSYVVFFKLVPKGSYDLIRHLFGTVWDLLAYKCVNLHQPSQEKCISAQFERWIGNNYISYLPKNAYLRFLISLGMLSYIWFIATVHSLDGMVEVSCLSFSYSLISSTLMSSLLRGFSFWSSSLTRSSVRTSETLKLGLPFPVFYELVS